MTENHSLQEFDKFKYLAANYLMMEEDMRLRKDDDNKRMYRI